MIEIWYHAKLDRVFTYEKTYAKGWWWRFDGEFTRIIDKHPNSSAYMHFIGEL